MAEGVRIYNQDTWKLVTHGQGKQLVERHIPQMVEFYISQSEADNHAVREAACACIAELGSKVVSLPLGFDSESQHNVCCIFSCTKRVRTCVHFWCTEYVLVYACC